jgi:allantoate deiminase
MTISTSPDTTLRIDPAEIERTIAAFAQISEAGDGVTRLGYTDLERQAHAVFADEMSQLGLEVTVDAAGNTIAELAGVEARPAVGTGSHLDSVPQGGRFDGIAGVCAAMAVARALVSERRRPQHPWRFVAFATEEGARFGQACNGSRAVAGLTEPDDLHRLVDGHGVSMFDAMRSVGLAPDQLSAARWAPDQWHAFVELHIEQGTVLEAADAAIGIVDVISGSSRLEVHLGGVASHTGGTPMHQRHDALAAAAECILRCEQIATDLTHHGTRVTVGRLNVQPNSITTIPGAIVFSVDVRDFDSARQRATARLLNDEFALLCATRGVEYDCDVIGDTSPVMLPLDVIDAITDATTARGLSYRVLPSGASHDAQQISRITPTGMIFVPSIDGLSHVPAERTEYADIARGAEVLLDTMLLLDSRPSEITVDRADAE